MLAALPLPAAASLAAYQAGWWLPFIGPALATALALIGGVLVNYATEGRQKRFIRSAFRQYLSEDVIRELVNHPERLTLGGEQRTLSIFFSDLQGFTGIAERLEPRELTSLLNEYLSAMTDIIQAEGGTVDKYEGDAIIAFWNAPLPQDDHAARAVRAALQCQARLAEMRPDLRARYGGDLFMRIGVNTGPVVVGNMGSHNRFNYTILG
ncbi:MAG: adenylate/guanylate cyclase domain-containing protein, partial [Lentisphaerae bacterium]|nr:adenylate/guanylate cyclase domain-containing protein [Lentisphaerota bacterium]